jgi:hypothetical protein
MKHSKLWHSLRAILEAQGRRLGDLPHEHGVSVLVGSIGIDYRGKISFSPYHSGRMQSGDTLEEALKPFAEKQ